ncbi:MAG TPA: CcmD family protein [Bacteroidota bacterium]|nr:CcmD family protein [Bacteroidota bacterium]
MFEFLNQNPLYVVLVIVLVVWLGIYMYLFRIEGKITRMEKQTGK